MTTTGTVTLNLHVIHICGNVIFNYLIGISACFYIPNRVEFGVELVVVIVVISAHAIN